MLLLPSHPHPHPPIRTHHMCVCVVYAPIAEETSWLTCRSFTQGNSSVEDRLGKSTSRAQRVNQIGMKAGRSKMTRRILERTLLGYCNNFQSILKKKIYTIYMYTSLLFCYGALHHSLIQCCVAWRNCSSAFQPQIFAQVDA